MNFNDSNCDNVDPFLSLTCRPTLSISPSAIDIEIGKSIRIDLQIEAFNSVD